MLQNLGAHNTATPREASDGYNHLPQQTCSESLWDSCKTCGVAGGTLAPPPPVGNQHKPMSPPPPPRSSELMLQIYMPMSGYRAEVQALPCDTRG